MIELETIIQIYQTIKKTKTGIRPERSNIRIIKGGQTLTSGEVVYTPPKGNEILIDLLNNCIEFINDDGRHDLDPLLKMAISHYQFEDTRKHIEKHYPKLDYSIVEAIFT